MRSTLDGLGVLWRCAHLCTFRSAMPMISAAAGTEPRRATSLSSSSQPSMPFLSSFASTPRYNVAMRIYLDGSVSLWLRQAFDRPYSHDNAADARQWGRIDDRIGSDMHGSYIDVSKAEPDLLGWFMTQLVLKSMGKTYGPAFRRIAREVAAAAGASAVDRLADLVREQDIKRVKFGKTRRDKAIDNLTKRKRELG